MSIESITAKLSALQTRVRPMFRPLGIAASGLSAQRQRLDVIASNIANAETTRTAEGGPYRRRIVELQSKATAAPFGMLEAGKVYPSGVPAGELPPPPFEEPGEGVEVAGVVADTSEGPLVYDPGHPDANEDGYVRMPNVNLTDEIVAMMETRRMYEANATVFEAIKNMLQRAARI